MSHNNDQRKRFIVTAAAHCCIFTVLYLYFLFFENTMAGGWRSQQYSLFDIIRMADDNGFLLIVMLVLVLPLVLTLVFIFRGIRKVLREGIISRRDWIYSIRLISLTLILLAIFSFIWFDRSTLNILPSGALVYVTMIWFLFYFIGVAISDYVLNAGSMDKDALGDDINTEKPAKAAADLYSIIALFLFIFIAFVILFINSDGFDDAQFSVYGYTLEGDFFSSLLLLCAGMCLASAIGIMNRVRHAMFFVLLFSAVLAGNSPARIIMVLQNNSISYNSKALTIIVLSIPIAYAMFVYIVHINMSKKYFDA